MWKRRTCLNIRAQFSAWLNGDLSSPAAERVQEHVTECPDCARELAELEWTLSQVRRLEPLPVPEGLRAVVRARLAEEVHTPARVLPKQWWLALAGGSIAAAICGCWLLWHLITQPLPSPEISIAQAPEAIPQPPVTRNMGAVSPPSPQATSPGKMAPPSPEEKASKMAEAILKKPARPMAVKTRPLRPQRKPKEPPQRRSPVSLTSSRTPVSPSVPPKRTAVAAVREPVSQTTLSLPTQPRAVSPSLPDRPEGGPDAAEILSRMMALVALDTRRSPVPSSETGEGLAIPSISLWPEEKERGPLEALHQGRFLLPRGLRMAPQHGGWERYADPRVIVEVSEGK